VEPTPESTHTMMGAILRPLADGESWERRNASNEQGR
jgi:hypothetical protein